MTASLLCMQMEYEQAHIQYNTKCVINKQIAEALALEGHMLLYPLQSDGPAWWTFPTHRDVSQRHIQSSHQHLTKVKFTLDWKPLKSPKFRDPLCNWHTLKMICSDLPRGSISQGLWWVSFRLVDLSTRVRGIQSGGESGGKSYREKDMT